MATNEDSSRDRGRDRFRGRGRGAFVHFYEDMGTSSTEEGHEKFVVAKDKWDKAIAQQKAQVANARSQLNEYMGQYDAAEQELKGLMSQYEEIANTPISASGFSVPSYNEVYSSNTTPVRVVNSKGEIEATYNIPVESAEKFASELSSSGLTASAVDGGKNVNVLTKAGGRTVGQEVHDALRTGEQKAKEENRAEYDREVANARAEYDAAIAAAQNQKQAVLNEYSSAISTGQTQLSEFSSKLSEANANVSAAEAEVKSSEGLMASELNNIKLAHKDKEGIIREIFSEMGIDKGDFKWDDETGFSLTLDQVKTLMDERGLPDNIIMSNGKIDQDKVDILSTFLIDQLIAEKEREKKKGENVEYASSFEQMMQGENNAA